MSVDELLFITTGPILLYDYYKLSFHTNKEKW